MAQRAESTTNGSHGTSPLPIPLFDTQRQTQAMEAELLEAIKSVVVSGRFVLGPDVTELERELAEYCGAKHAVSCASGSDALLLALMAHDIGPGDEVLLPSYTFFATASAVWRLGARPVFVDLDPESFNIEPRRLREQITPVTKAIIPVHLYGQSAKMGPILELAERHRLAVIEDACQAIGAELDGRRAGSIGTVGCFSFYPTKNLGGMGDGGLLTTNDDRLADRLQLLRGHGMRPRYHHHEVGINSRLDTLQAAVLRVKLRHLETWTERRRANAARYRDLFQARGLDRWLTLPREFPGHRHVWNQYIVRVPGEQRDSLQRFLTEQRIGSEIYYPIPLHQQLCFRGLSRDGLMQDGRSLPESERAARETLALPIFPELERIEQDRVVEAITRYHAEHVQAPATKRRAA